MLLGIAGGEGAEDDTSARAVAALGNSLTSPQVRDFLKSALRTQREATAHRCLRILGQMGGPEAIHALTAGADGRVGAAALRARSPSKRQRRSPTPATPS